MEIEGFARVRAIARSEMGNEAESRSLEGPLFP